MDFIFGTLATDELRLLHQRIAKQGVQHAYKITPMDPKPGEPVTLHLLTGQDIPVDHVACYYTVDGSTPKGNRATPTNGKLILFQKVDIQWDTATFGYSTYWQCILPGQPEDTMVKYRISAWSIDGEEVFADYPELKATSERAAMAFFQGTPLPDLPPLSATAPETFVYTVDHLQPPTWAQHTIIYHIFIDRFYPGDGKDWIQTHDVSNFYGGTLHGVHDKLDYIEALGVDCMWLSPVLQSPTHHGYDATDFKRVEARLGGEEALHKLIEAAHARDIRILLDLAVNHASNHLPEFKSAFTDENSPYRNWFIIDEAEPHGYKTFFNSKIMPIVNLNNPETRQWMIEIGQFWLREFKIDGYRLDHANGAGPGFWAEFRRACREINPACYLFGEVVEAPDIMRTYSGKLDGLLDFYLADGLRRTYGWKTMTEAELACYLHHHTQFYSPTLSMPSFLDNHDMDRFLYIAQGDKNALRQAAEKQFQHPAPLVIYYGTEVGLSQKEGVQGPKGLDESRLPMLWDDAQDTELLTFYQALIKSRRSNNMF